MSIDSNPSCPIIARFAEDLKLNGKRPRTQQSYCRGARKFAEYLGHSPDLATEDQFRNYLIYLVECKKWKSSTVNVAVQALKFFYRVTCPRDWSSLKLARIKVEQKLPVVITIGEVNCQAVGDGRDSLRYLAPYVFRVAVGNHRIRSVECHEDGTGSVTFTVKPSGEKHYRPMTVPAEEFIRRFLQHVLPKGFQKVRHFGFMHKRSKISRVWLAMLVTVTLNMVYVLVVNPPGPPAKQPMSCPDCGGDLECLGFARNTFTQSAATSPMIIDTSQSPKVSRADQLARGSLATESF